MDCVFCSIASMKVPARILSKTAHSMAFLDAFPLARGHVLVIPRNHREKVQDLSRDENADLFSLVYDMVSKVDGLTGATLIAVHNGQGAGQEIPHLHVHLVPRSQDDSAGAIHSMFDSTVDIPDDEIAELYDKLKD